MVYLSTLVPFPFHTYNVADKPAQGDARRSLVGREQVGPDFNVVEPGSIPRSVLDVLQENIGELVEVRGSPSPTPALHDRLLDRHFVTLLICALISNLIGALVGTLIGALVGTLIGSLTGLP